MYIYIYTVNSLKDNYIRIHRLILREKYIKYF